MVGSRTVSSDEDSSDLDYDDLDNIYSSDSLEGDEVAGPVAEDTGTEAAGVVTDRTTGGVVAAGPATGRLVVESVEQLIRGCANTESGFRGNNRESEEELLPEDIFVLLVAIAVDFF